MRVEFDKLNRFEIPTFTLCNPGSVYEDGRLSRVVGVLNNTSDEEVVINFDSISELNFRITKVPSDGSAEGDYVLGVYKAVQNRRMIFVDDIGYFVITEISEDIDDEGITYKDVTASSCEIEIQNKALFYVEDGTYRFLDIFEDIVASLPRWKIGYIDSIIAERYRTFEDIDTSTDTLSFMMDDMQDAYECIFVFDTINRIINVYDQCNYLLRTNIHLSNKDLITSTSIRENADDLFTALSVYGDDDLSISAINPIGSTTIYNFSYYLDWMSSALRERVVSWQELVESYQRIYYELNVMYYDLLSQKENVAAEISRLNLQLETYSKCRENVVAEQSPDIVGEYNSVIEDVGGEQVSISDSIEEILSELDTLIADVRQKISEQQFRLELISADIAQKESRIAEIHDEVSFQGYFTQDEYDELFDYIFEGTYQDEYIITTENMSITEKLVQMQELYSKALRKLDAVSSPVREFDITSEAFVFSKEFLPWTEQIEAGCLINVEMDDGEIVELFLTTIELNWHDQELSFTFGNTFKKTDPQSLFNDVLGDIRKSANSISYIKDVIYPVKSGKLDELEDALNNTNTLGLDESISSRSGEIRIDATGYTGKRKIASVVRSAPAAGVDGFMGEQLKITGNTIVFTEDAWETCRSLLGYVALPDSSTTYGLNAKSIVGELTFGDKLVIKDSQGNELLVIVDNKVASSVAEAMIELNKELNPKFQNLSDRIDGVSDSIGDLPDGTTVVEFVNEAAESVRYDDTALSTKVSNNEAAIVELRAAVEALATS